MWCGIQPAEKGSVRGEGVGCLVGVLGETNRQPWTALCVSWQRVLGLDRTAQTLTPDQFPLYINMGEDLLNQLKHSPNLHK